MVQIFFLICLTAQAAVAEATAALLPAAKKGDLPTVEDCIAKGANIDVTGEVRGFKDREATKGRSFYVAFRAKKGVSFPYWC